MANIKKWLTDNGLKKHMTPKDKIFPCQGCVFDNCQQYNGLKCGTDGEVPACGTKKKEWIYVKKEHI